MLFQEGVKIDAEGRATPYICNAKDANTGTVTIKPAKGARSFAEKEVDSRDIVLKFVGVDGFTVESATD